MKSFTVIIVFAIISRQCIVEGFETESGVFGKLKSGFQLAGKLLGLEQSSGVAQLVSDAFGKTSRKGDHDNGNTIFSGFLRILGFDSKKIGAIAVNAIIFVAQLISTSLSKPPPSQLTEARSTNAGTPFDWVMKNERLQDIIKISKDANLPHHINEYIKERSLDEDSGCIQLLVCKSAPFIWKMQKALNFPDKDKQKGKNALFEFMPTLEEVEDNAEECEQKHRYCSIQY